MLSSNSGQGSQMALARRDQTPVDAGSLFLDAVLKALGPLSPCRGGSIHRPGQKVSQDLSVFDQIGEAEVIEHGEKCGPGFMQGAP